MRFPVINTFGAAAMVSCGKLRTVGIVRICVFCVIVGLFGLEFAQAQGPGGGGGGPEGRGGRGRRGFDPAQMVKGMDQDNNGIITANEVERLPPFIRDRWTQQGIDFNRGVSVEELQQVAQRGMEEMRRNREERGGGGPERPEFPPGDMNPGGGPGGPPPGGFPPSGPPSPPAAPSTPAAPVTSGPQRSRVSPLIPDTFKSIDLNSDGQVALFEWRKSKRGSLAEFKQHDLDQDGFLIPKELAKVTAPAAATPPSQPSASPASATPTPPTTPPAPVAVSAEAAVKAGRAFDLLDKDKSGTVANPEWADSNRLRPLFEKGGYDLNKPMTKDEFTQAFVRVGG